MRLHYISLLTGLLCLLSTKGWSQEAPFTKGVNLTNWFQAGSAQQIQFTKFSKQDFENIKSLGCDVIRLPINLHAMTSGSPDYTLDPLFLEFLDETADWAEELNIHLIFDNHTFDPATNTDPSIETPLIEVWSQMAGHFKDRSSFIYYEVLNEPHGIDDAVWGGIQQNVINAIRAVDDKHTIIVGPASWNSFHNLNLMPDYGDDNLIYTFHFYDPFIFTHQGASWTNPSMVPLADVPFPYTPANMPEVPGDLEGTWLESAMDDYSNEGTVARVKELINIAIAFRDDRKVPVYCGEFGVYIPNSNANDRIYWYDVVQDYLEQNGIAWTMWDYTGGFGIFKSGGNDLFDHDLNIQLVQALDLKEVEQTAFTIQPDSAGFDIYRDYISKHAVEAGNAGEGSINYYNSSALKGEYCIEWNNASQYSGLGFDFKPNKDLSYLVDQDYALAYWVKASAPASYDVRFVDTDTEDPEDHPWRMRYTIDEGNNNWNGRWQPVQIPLQQFEEQGAWEGEWFNPQGDFDWAAIDKLEIIAEHGDLSGVKILIDDIRITNESPDEPITDLPEIDNDRKFEIYPNPVGQNSMIDFYLPAASTVEIKVSPLTGQSDILHIHEYLESGNYQYRLYDLLDNHSLAEGLYICQFKTTDMYIVKKLLVKEKGYHFH